MKEIKAYIRRSRADSVIGALESAGIRGMTVIDVQALCEWADKTNYKYSIEYCERYSNVVKLELVCSDDEVEKLVKAIIEKGRTGKRGDGMIFISPIETAVHIRTNQINNL